MPISLPRVARLARPLVLGLVVGGALMPAAAVAAEPSPEVAKMLAEVDSRRIERSIGSLAGFGTRHTLSSQTDPVRGVGAARNWLLREFQAAAAGSGGRMTVELQTFIQPISERVPRPTPITNVVATLRGTQGRSAGRHYVVSGHYDTRCSDPLDFRCDAPGANDDASGVAATLELARVMATRKWDATIVFMAVAGEEQGLYGSTYFAKQAKRRKLNIQGMFTNDIIGSSTGGNGVRDPFSVRLFAQGPWTDETRKEAELRSALGAENDAPPRQLARYVKEQGENDATGMRRVRIVNRLDRFLRGGDHRPFLEQRFPAARFTEPNEDYRHQHQDVRVEKGTVFGDLVRFVDFAYTARVARVNGAALAALASAPASPSKVKIVAKDLTYDTELDWNRNREPDLAGYEVVWRRTTEAEWTNSRRVGRHTRAVMQDISKDDFLFGVRAVDSKGNRSPVSFPTEIVE